MAARRWTSTEKGIAAIDEDVTGAPSQTVFNAVGYDLVKVIEAATKLKVVGRAGIGVDNVDIPAASRRGIIVMNTPFGNSITTAEHAIAMLLALARQISQANARTQNGEWPKSDYMGVELTGKTLGVIGAGNIGGIVCDRARGLKMKVLAYDPFLGQEKADKMGVEKVELEELLKRGRSAGADEIPFAALGAPDATLAGTM